MCDIAALAIGCHKWAMFSVIKVFGILAVRLLIGSYWCIQDLTGQRTYYSYVGWKLCVATIFSMMFVSFFYVNFSCRAEKSTCSKESIFWDCIVFGLAFPCDLSFLKISFFLNYPLNVKCKIYKKKKKLR